MRTFAHRTSLKDDVSRLLINVQSAWRSLAERPQRSLLSALGIMVGATAIVLLVSIALGVRNDIRGQVEDLGVNVLIVVPGRVSDDAMFNPNIAGLSYLSEEDLAVVRRVPGVVAATPMTFAGGGISAGAKSSPTTLLLAVEPSWFSIHPTKLSEGAVFGEGDSPVCVIGSLAKKELFGDADAVGKTVDINGANLKVVGVTQDKSSESSLFSMGGFENVAYIPFAYEKKVAPVVMVHRIMMSTSPDKEPKALVRAVESALSRRLEKSMFSVLTQEDLLKLVFKIMSILTWLLTGLTSIALFVGGVGIMTVMLMSVNERSSEIGIRKTVGAKSADIFAQFLAEAAMLSLLGGSVGLAFGYGVDLALTAWTPIKPDLTQGVVALTMIVSVGFGCVFGLLPALRAAGKDPVDAIRTA